MPNTTNLPDMPPGLAARPRDERRGLPIPAVNEQPDGTADFVSINGQVALNLAVKGCCSLCTLRLEGPAAFLGGPRAADAGWYSDPPMHEACAQAALLLCPHMAHQHARRASAGRTPAGTAVPVGFSEAKPDEWVMVLAADYYSALAPAEGGGVAPVFIVGERLAERRFSYQDGVLTEQGAD
ncbi:hypothetical protein OH807_30740 [Kitasatospora sp. NBC_01560]|uniref:hypothetical protein n=1 Tax=Kitasatospora sp. NBC_01560 TaxID=2975965 RepID=UPI00386EDE9A